jgi:2-furoyl-CoA dehydrogenase FAD binding subunit
MKAAPFAYLRPATLDDVLAELDRDELGAKLLAGGQSLVPVLAMRLARPSTLIDLSAVRGLAQVEHTSDTLTVGAMVRQRLGDQGHSGSNRRVLLQLALPWVGHREVRSRGTVCGSLAHADPSAELPAVACCLDAELEVTGQSGVRRVRARDFFTAAMTTTLDPAEVLTAVHFPTAVSGEGYALGEIARRHGDYALAGVAVRIRVADGRVSTAELTAFGVAERPVTWDATDSFTRSVADAGPGTDPAAMNDVLRAGAASTADELVTTEGDAHGSQGYRRRLLTVLASRELSNAYRRAISAPPLETR